MIDPWEIGRLDGVAQAGLVARGEVSARELTDAAVARIEILEPGINAVSWRAFDLARERATAFDHSPFVAPLAGVPYLIKDSLDYPDMPARSGSRFREPVVARSAFPLAQAFDRAGLIPLGKSTMPEFALLPSTEPVLGGPTRNPWNPDLSVGGSSGGAAAAVASGMVPVAHASDGAGSIRIPAACCNLVGLKPSRGANVRARGAHVLEDMLTGDGLIARTVRDVAAGFAIGGGAAGALPGRPLRIALIPDSLDGTAPDPVVAAGIDHAARACEAMGHRIEPARYPVDPGAVADAFHVAWAYLGGEVVDLCRATAGGRDVDGLLEAWTLGMAGFRATIAPDRLAAAYATIGMLPAAFGQFFERYDVVLSPVLREPPAAVGRMSGTRDFDALREDMFGYVSYTPLHNLAGLPAVSVPSGAIGAAPVGAMFAAGHGHDGMLLALAAELEQALGWPARWPDPASPPA